VQEPSLSTSPVRSIPLLPPVFAPLVPRSRPSQSSRQESISSEDPTPDTGYEPSAVSDDFDDADHRSTIRPHQYTPNAHYNTRQPPSPVSPRVPHSSPADRRRLYDDDFHTGTAMQASHSAPVLEDTLARRDLRPVVTRELESAGGRRPSPSVTRSGSQRKKIPRPDASISARPPQPPRRAGGQVAPTRYYITWKASDPASGSSPSKNLRPTKSTEMLRNLGPSAPLRPSPSRSQLHVAPNPNIRPFEPAPVPRAHRPLPPTTGAVVESTDTTVNGPTRPFLQPQPSSAALASSATYLSPTQEPYPRPHSASPSQQRFPKPVDGLLHDVSRERDTQRPLPGLHHQSHSTGGSVSKFGDTPFREDCNGIILPLSLRPGPYVGSPVRPHVQSETPPRSPVSAGSSRPSTSTGSSSLAYTSSGTMVASRQNSSSSGQDTLSESTLRPDQRDKVIGELKARVSAPKVLQPPDTPVGSVVTLDDYATAAEDLWSRRPISQIHNTDTIESAPSPRSSPRPALNVITQSQNNNVRGVPPNFPPPPDFIPQPQPQPRLRDPRPRTTPRDGHKSTFEEFTWAHRPAPEDVYDRLEDFFPEHDLDKPVIEANSGGTSPTAADQTYGIPQNDRERIGGVRGKKSIRIVAEEHKKRLDRTSRAESSYGNLLRRSTKLWGGQVEEVTTSQKKQTMSKPMADTSSGGPRRMSSISSLNTYLIDLCSYFQMGSRRAHRKRNLWTCLSCSQRHNWRDDCRQAGRDTNNCK
jgi:hypothetical protein